MVYPSLVRTSMKDRIAILALAFQVTMACCLAQVPPPPSSGASAPQSAAQTSPNGGVQILSDTRGVNFSPYLKEWHSITQKTWHKLMPKEVNPPKLTKGIDVIRFKIMPDGRVTYMKLEGRSGTESLDRAAWGAIAGSSYPRLPNEFHGPYVVLRAYFLYNMKTQ